MTWGNGHFGGDSRAVQAQLVGVQQIQATSRAFAALLRNKSVVSWGDNRETSPYCIDMSDIETMTQVVSITVSRHGFAALLADGSVSVWGFVFVLPNQEIQRLLADSTRTHVYGGRNGFACILDDGSVVTWPSPSAHFQ